MTSKQADMNDYSEIRIRMKKKEIEELKTEAASNGLTLSTYIKGLIRISRGGRLINTVSTDDLLTYISAIQPAVEVMTESIKMLKDSPDISTEAISKIEQDRSELIHLMKEQLRQTILTRKKLIRKQNNSSD